MGTWLGQGGGEGGAGDESCGDDGTNEERNRQLGVWVHVVHEGGGRV